MDKKKAVALHQKMEGYGGYTLVEVFKAMKDEIEEWKESTTMFFPPYIRFPKKKKFSHA